MLVEQLLSGWPAIQIRAVSPSSGAGPPRATDFPEPADVDFRVGRLALGYDERNSLYTLLAHDVESDVEEEADFACQATRAQLRALSDSITPLLAAGRPRCPMCEEALGTGKHRCRRSNGHIRGIEK
jgi:hypothetical protein